jgi:hypothetical protein
LRSGSNLAPEALDFAAKVGDLLLLRLSVLGEGLVGDSGNLPEGASVGSRSEGSHDGEGGTGFEGFIHVDREVRVGSRRHWVVVFRVDIDLNLGEREWGPFCNQ